MRFTPAFLDELRARVTLSDLIGRTVKVTRAGREFKACCPFHNEKTPSFTINDDKGFYHCFGCSAHGDAIRWMTDHNNLGFVEAIETLAAEAGVDVPAASAEAAQHARRIEGQRPTLEAAQRIFAEQLQADRYLAPKLLLTDRGIGADLVEEFGIGFAPEDGALNGKGFNRGDLIAVGLVGASEGRGGGAPFYYPRFRARIMIPIHDARGRIVGFGGRTMPGAKEGAAKYVNSPDSAIFDKGGLLFNLHRARELYRSTRRLIMVEGYMDVIALHRLGLAAVAPMGTAVTDRQLERAWRIDSCPLLLFDGDGAGVKAAVRACEAALPMLGPGRSLSVGALPAGVDPDDLVRSAVEAGEDPAQVLGAWLACNQPKSAQAVLRDAALTSRDGSSPEAWAAVWQQMKGWGEMIVDPDVRHLTLKDWRSDWEAACGFDASDGDGAVDMSLIGFVERIERLVAERSDINADIRDVRAEAKSQGYDTKAIDAVLKARKQDQHDRIETEAMIVVYRDAVGIGGPLSAAMRASPLAEPVRRKPKLKGNAPPPPTRRVEAMTDMIEGRGL